MDNTMEVQKVEAEIAKLLAETARINVETRKLTEETKKLSKENFWYPVVVAAGFIVAIGTVVKVFF